MHRVDITCLGEPLYEFSEQRDHLWRAGFGGDVANVAVAAARHSATARIITRVGEDHFGEAFLNRWRTEGVDTAFVATDPARPTGLYFIRYDKTGHHFEYRRAGSAASAITPDTLPAEALAHTKILHGSGITQAISDTSAATLSQAMQIVKTKGGMVSFDPNLRLNLTTLAKARAELAAILPMVDILLPGLDDAICLTGLTEPTDITAFYQAEGVPIIALTMGGEGVLVATQNAQTQIPAHPVKAVDASGAGDCFDGAFLAEFLATGDAITAARYAAVAASLSTETIGALDAIPTRIAVQAAMCIPHQHGASAKK